MGVIALFTYKFLFGITGSIISLLIAMTVSIFVLYVLYRLLKVHEFNQIVSTIVRKIKR
jgi:hypothetical protein